MTANESLKLPLPGDSNNVLLQKICRNVHDVATVSSLDWIRPSDWLPIPVLAEGSQQFSGLLAITDDESNYVALLAAADYTVDWGDGSALENVASGVKAEHFYTFSSIPASTVTTLGYRQVLVTVTPQAGQNLTTLNLQQKHSVAPTGVFATYWLDISLNSPNLTTMVLGGTTLTRFSWLEKVTLGQIGTITSFASLFTSDVGLRNVVITGSSAVTNFSNMFASCSSLQSVPLFNTAAGTDFSNMFASCSSLQSVPLFNTAAGTNFLRMFRFCISLQGVPRFNAAAVTIFSGTFEGCTALQSVPLFNTAAGTTFLSMFNSCPSLSDGALAGTTFTISYANCKLSTTAIVEIFNALGTAAGAQTVTVSGNLGYAGLTPADIAIATGKGWTVA